MEGNKDKSSKRVSLWVYPEDHALLMKIRGALQVSRGQEISTIRAMHLALVDYATKMGVLTDEENKETKTTTTNE